MILATCRILRIRISTSLEKFDSNVSSLLARCAAEERSCRKFSTLRGRRQLCLSGQTSRNEKCIYRYRRIWLFQDYFRGENEKERKVVASSTLKLNLAVVYAISHPPSRALAFKVSLLRRGRNSRVARVCIVGEARDNPVSRGSFANFSRFPGFLFWLPGLSLGTIGIIYSVGWIC